MTFSPEQIAALKADLNRSHVAQRTQAGRNLSYIEAWHAIAEANRIFGFDRWHRETVEMRQLGEPRLVDGKYRVGYMAKVRIEVFTAGGVERCVVREGSGFGSGIDKDVDQAHESALKEAESDAMKRALMTFGNPFGLALYDKTQAHVSDARAPAYNPDNPPPGGNATSGSGRLAAAEAKRRGEHDKIRNEIRGLDKEALANWMTRFDDRTAHLPLSWLDSIRDIAESHLADLEKPREAEEMDEGFRGAVGPGPRSASRVAGNNGAHPIHNTVAGRGGDRIDARAAAIIGDVA